MELPSTKAQTIPGKFICHDLVKKVSSNVPAVGILSKLALGMPWSKLSLFVKICPWEAEIPNSNLLNLNSLYGYLSQLSSCWDGSILLKEQPIDNLASKSSRILIQLNHWLHGLLKILLITSISKGVWCRTPLIDKIQLNFVESKIYQILPI